MNALLLMLALVRSGPETGRLMGYVFDQVGTPLPGVRLTATVGDRVQVASSDRDGAFAFSGLSPGSYTVEARAPMFQRLVQANVTVRSGAVVELNLIMMVVDQLFEQPVIGRGCPPLLPSLTVPRLEPEEEFIEPLPMGVAASLVIHEQGQPDVMLAAGRAHLQGQVRGAVVKVEVKPRQIVGHLAGEPIGIWMRGLEAEGHIGGHDVGFTLYETPTGHLLRGQAVGHTVRIEESHGALSWLPACERPLVRLPREGRPETIYQGACASGRRVRLTLPDEWQRMRPLPRLILLALLLAEREEVTAAARLFPPKVNP